MKSTRTTPAPKVSPTVAIVPPSADPAEVVERLIADRRSIKSSSETALYDARELFTRLADHLPEEIDAIVYAARVGAEAAAVAVAKATILSALSDLSKIMQSLAATVGNAGELNEVTS